MKLTNQQAENEPLKHRRTKVCSQNVGTIDSKNKVKRERKTNRNSAGQGSSGESDEEESSTSTTNSDKYPSGGDQAVVGAENEAKTPPKRKTKTNKVKVLIPVAAAVGGFCLAPAVATYGLGLVGFTKAGVAAGSLAASLQTPLTAGGSLFAMAQSAAATGTISTAWSAAAGGVTGATAWLLSTTKTEKK